MGLDIFVGCNSWDSLAAATLASTLSMFQLGAGSSSTAGLKYAVGMGCRTLPDRQALEEASESER